MIPLALPVCLLYQFPTIPIDQAHEGQLTCGEVVSAVLWLHREAQLLTVSSI